MKFEELSPIDDIGVAKATAHQNGKIGFSMGANKLMDLDNQRHYKVSKNGDDPNDQNLYMVAAPEDDPKAFKVSKAGKYYYLRLRHVLDKFKLNYKDYSIIFDIKED